MLQVDCHNSTLRMRKRNRSASGGQTTTDPDPDNPSTSEDAPILTLPLDNHFSVLSLSAVEDELSFNAQTTLSPPPIILQSHSDTILTINQENDLETNQQQQILQQSSSEISLELLSRVKNGSDINSSKISAKKRKFKEKRNKLLDSRRRNVSFAPDDKLATFIDVQRRVMSNDIEFYSDSDSDSDSGSLLTWDSLIFSESDKSCESEEDPDIFRKNG